MKMNNIPLWKTAVGEYADFRDKYENEIKDFREHTADGGSYISSGQTQNDIQSGGQDNQQSQPQPQSQTIQEPSPQNDNPYAEGSGYITAEKEDEAKSMYQNGLVSAMAPREDYWDDNSSESYYPHSDWIGPSGAIWTSMYGRY